MRIIFSITLLVPLVILLSGLHVEAEIQCKCCPFHGGEDQCRRAAFSKANEGCPTERPVHLCFTVTPTRNPTTRPSGPTPVATFLGTPTPSMDSRTDTPIATFLGTPTPSMNSRTNTPIATFIGTPTPSMSSRTDTPIATFIGTKRASSPQ